MSDRITARDCEQAARLVAREMLNAGLLALDEALVIERGSATYGRAWKVFITGGQYGTAWHNPPFGSLYSSSARELREKLIAILRTLEAVNFERGQAYARERIAEGVTA